MDFETVLFILENVDFEIPGSTQQEVIDFVKQSHDRERVLEDKIHLLKHGFGIYDKEFPEDYVRFFKNQKINIANLITENDKYKDRERVLREALQGIITRILIPEDNADTVIFVTNIAKEALDASK